MPSPANTADTTVLEMHADASLVLRIAGTQTLLRRPLPLGVDTLVKHSFRHTPPQPTELEHAIEWTEEAVMPLAAQCAGSTVLQLRGLGAGLIAHSLRCSGLAQTKLTLDEVETLFNRLVLVSQGRPTSQETLPTDARSYAALLVLREFMHHLHFAQVTLLPD